MIKSLINTAHKLSVDVTQFKNDNTENSNKRSVGFSGHPAHAAQFIAPGFVIILARFKASKEVVVSCNVASQQK
jgi:hypothetical protein